MDPTYKGLPTPVPAKLPRPGLNWKIVLIIGGSFLVILTILGLIFARGGSSASLPRVGYRLDNLSSLSSGASINIKDSELKKLNAELAIVIDGDRTALKDILPTAKNDKALTDLKSEEAARLTTQKDSLKTALASGSHDATYRQILQDELKTLFALAETAYKESSSSKTRQILANLQQHLTFYFNQLGKN